MTWQEDNVIFRLFFLADNILPQFSTRIILFLPFYGMRLGVGMVIWCMIIKIWRRGGKNLNWQKKSSLV